MEKVQSNKVNGRVVVQFIQTYNSDASCFNRYHRGKSGNTEVAYINWADTVNKLNDISGLDAEEIKTAINKANQAYYRALEEHVFPLLMDKLGLEDISSMW